MSTSASAGGDGLARTFAKVFGVVLLVVGLLGLVLGDKRLLDILNIDLVEDLIHIASGSLLLYLGFKADGKTLRSGLLVLGAVYLVVTLLGFLAPGVIESLNPHGYTIVDNLIHLAVGVGAIATALSGRDDR